MISKTHNSIIKLSKTLLVVFQRGYNMHNQKHLCNYKTFKALCAVSFLLLCQLKHLVNIVVVCKCFINKDNCAEHTVQIHL